MKILAVLAMLTWAWWPGQINGWDRVSAIAEFLRALSLIIAFVLAVIGFVCGAHTLGWL